MFLKLLEGIAVEIHIRAWHNGLILTKLGLLFDVDEVY